MDFKLIGADFVQVDAYFVLFDGVVVGKCEVSLQFLKQNIKLN